MLEEEGVDISAPARARRARISLIGIPYRDLRRLGGIWRLLWRRNLMSSTAWPEQYRKSIAAVC